MLRKIREYITRHGLLPPGEHVLAAVSGGADSTAMLDVLARLAPDLGIRVTAAHLDHRIRGAASRADAVFTEEFADSLKIDFVAGRSDVPGLARRRGISLETAAREARYGFLRRAARRAGAGAVATAHTADDQAETVLLKLARGAGSRGLAGIPRLASVSGVRIVRPMLDATRHEIESYLRARGLAWREDETNRDTGPMRNRVRRMILPLMERELNPNIKRAVARFADIFREEDAYLDEMARNELSKCIGPRGRSGLDGIAVERCGRAISRRVIRLWLDDAGVPAGIVDFAGVDSVERLIRDKRGTKRIELGGGWVVVRNYGAVSLRHEHAAAVPACNCPVIVPGETVLPEPGLRIVTWLETGIAREKGLKPGALPARASLRYEPAESRKLRVRTWKKGDRISPLRLAGTRKLQDIFVDAKIPADSRAFVPVFECRNEIVWLPGYGVARGWQVGGRNERAIQVRIERL